MDKEEVYKAKIANRDAAINNVFKGVEGIMVLNYLHDICGYAQSNCVANAQTGAPQPEFSFYNEGRRSVYLELRNLIHPETLKESEFKAE